MLNIKNKKLFMVKSYRFFNEKKYTFFFKRNIFISYHLNIKVVGKVYRWFFFSKKINFKINKSNSSELFFKKSYFNVISKSKLSKTLVFKKPIRGKKLLFYLGKTRPYNIFTGRGVFYKNFFLKKSGKISSYV